MEARLSTNETHALSIIMDDLQNPVPWQADYKPNYDFFCPKFGLTKARTNEIWQEAKKRIAA